MLQRSSQQPIQVDVTVGGQHFRMDEQSVLGVGGEAIVFSMPSSFAAKPMALKVYHDPTPARGEKLVEFMGENFRLPPEILAPKDLAYSGRRVVGFTMDKFPSSFVPLEFLGVKKYRQSHHISGRAVAQWFLHIYRVLDETHGAGFTVGDVSGLNILVDPRSGDIVVFIDVDSYQFGRFPCPVMTEDYGSPDLYGNDLSRRPLFKEHHDWYAYAVLLCRSLLFIHPFRGGIHKTHKNLMTRAAHGVTVFDHEVSYPPFALPAEVLSDELQEALIRILKRQTTNPFPVEVLKEYAELLVECRSCGLWYPAKRDLCPGCTARTMLTTKLAAKLVKIAAQVLLESTGTIRFYQPLDTAHACIAEEHGQVVLYRREKGAQQQTHKQLFPAIPGSRYGLFDGSLVVCLNPTDDEPALYVVDVSGPQPVPVIQLTTARQAGRKAVFSCSGRRLYRIAGPRLMCGYRFGQTVAEMELMGVVPNQTWFTAAPAAHPNKDYVFGFYQVFGEMKWFLLVVDLKTNKASRYEVNLPPLGRTEALVDLSVKFSSSSVLVIRKTQHRNDDVIRVETVNTADGTVVHTQRTLMRNKPVYEHGINGRAYRRGKILHPTAQGMVYENLDTGDEELIPGSEDYADPEDWLYSTDGGIVVVKDDRVLFVTSNS